MLETSLISVDELDKARNVALRIAAYHYFSEELILRVVDRLEIRLWAKSPCDVLFFNKRWLPWQKFCVRIESIERRVEKLSLINESVLSAIELGNANVNTSYRASGITYPTAHCFANCNLRQIQFRLKSFSNVALPNFQRLDQIKKIVEGKELIRSLYEEIGQAWLGSTAWEEWQPDQNKPNTESWVQEPFAENFSFDDVNFSEYANLLSHEWRNARAWVEIRNQTLIGYKSNRWFTVNVRQKSTGKPVVSESIRQAKHRKKIRFQGEGKSVTYNADDFLRVYPEYEIIGEPK